MRLLKVLPLLLAFAMFLCPCVMANTHLSPTQLRSEVYNSVVLLYEQSETGDMSMRCTATAYSEKHAVGDQATYRLVSASHCVEGNTDEEEQEGKYFVTLDTAGPKTFIPAKLIEAGDRNIGDDFSIFEITTNSSLSITPLGDESTITLGDPVLSIGAPFGLGKQFFNGYVSAINLDRPPLNAGDVKWSNVMLIVIAGGPGSSGSAVVSINQGEIIGCLVGSFNDSTVGMIAVPVSRFKAFEKAVDNHTYKKTKSTPPPDPLDFD